MITSSGNSQVKELTRLFNQAKVRKERGLFLIEGSKMVEEALSEGRVVKLYFSQTYFDSLDSKAIPVEYEIVKDAVFQHISKTMTPQGVIGLVKMPLYIWEEVTAERVSKLLILENINDPGNLGTMFRTAEGAGFDGVILSKDTVDVLNPKVVRSTMGSILRMPFVYADNLREELIKLSKKGFTLYAADLHGSEEYNALKYDVKLGILIGNEANGLKPDTLDLVQKKVRIPMKGRLESLNASVAAALLMYETLR